MVGNKLIIGEYLLCTLKIKCNRIVAIIFVIHILTLIRTDGRRVMMIITIAKVSFHRLFLLLLLLLLFLSFLPLFMHRCCMYMFVIYTILVAACVHK